MTATAARLSAELNEGLKRLQLGHFRAVAADLLQTATTQRWAPEQLLRALIETEVRGRNAAGQAARLKNAGFPAAKSFGDFQVAASSVPPATIDYLASLEWLRARENLCLIGPPGTGKSHLLLAAGLAAIGAGRRVKYLLAAELVETLYRGLADNSVGKVIEGLLRHDAILIDELGFAPLDEVGTQLLFRFVAAAYEGRSPAHRKPLAVRAMGALPAAAKHCRCSPRPPPAPCRDRRHRWRVLPHEGSAQPPWSSAARGAARW